MNCVCIVHLICLNLCVQAGPTSNLLDESELLTGWEVLAIKNRMREVQAMKASARATKASAVVGLTGDQSSFSEVSTEGKNSMLVTKELVEKMTGEYDLRNKHEVKRKVQLQFLRQVIVQLETFQ